jgi:hypothetical protein
MDNKAKVVSKLLEDVEKKLGKSIKASLGDYIRLVQLQKELEEDEVREIKVRWIDPEAEEVEEAKKSKTEPKSKAKANPKAKPNPKIGDSAK